MRNTRCFILNLLCVYVLVTNHLLGQTLMKDGIETQWSAGQIVLNDGTILNGLVRFNEINGIISFKESDDAKESKSFKENKATSLFFIDSNGKKRSFFSFLYESDAGEEILLFEIIKEFKDWAVLGRRGTVEAREGKNDTGRNNEGLPSGKNTRAVLVQVEGIYAIDENGMIELFQYTSYGEVDGLIADYSFENKKIKKDVLQKRMKEYYKDVEFFAKENKLKPKRKSDLLKILDYYETLVSAN